MVKQSDIFICQQCGHCCQGDTTVSLDKTDQQRMIDHLGISMAEVCKKYWRQNGNTVQMKIVNGHCIFYDNGCTIHSGKPWRCTQWPLHPSILSDENNFTAIKDSCPGLNSKLTYEEFCTKLTALLEQSNK